MNAVGEQRLLQGMKRQGTKEIGYKVIVESIFGVFIGYVWNLVEGVVWIV